MPTPSQKKISQLLRIGENSRLDYKLRYSLSTENSKTELAKDISAIANYIYQTMGKGHIIIGANDSGRPIGINHSNYAETKIQQIICSRTDPPPTFSVHHVKYSGLNLTIIELQRNRSGPHQLKKNNRPAGFPIRRGSTTGMMTTNEVFQGMQARGRNFKNQRSEYETLIRVTRNQNIIHDCKSGLIELGIPPKSIVAFECKGKIRPEESRGHCTRKFLRIIKILNSKRWNIFLSFQANDAKLCDFVRLEDSIDGLIWENSLTKSRVIFVHFIHGNVSNSYFQKRLETWSGFIRINIEPRIVYLGTGQGRSKSNHAHNILLPKFFVSNIKSKEDIKTRIEIIVKWIEQRPQMFEDIIHYFEQ